MNLDDVIKESDDPSISSIERPRLPEPGCYQDELYEKVLAEEKEALDSYDPAFWKWVVDNMDLYAARISPGYNGLLEVRNEIILADNRTLWSDCRSLAGKNSQLEKEIAYLNEEADLLAEEAIEFEQKWRDSEERLKKKDERIALYNCFVACLEKILSPETYGKISRVVYNAFRQDKNNSKKIKNN